MSLTQSGSMGPDHERFLPVFVIIKNCFGIITPQEHFRKSAGLDSVPSLAPARAPRFVPARHKWYPRQNKTYIIRGAS